MRMDIETRILLVENSKDDAELNKREALKVLGNCLFEVAETRSGFLQKLASFKPHLILSDYALPVFDGLTALSLAIEHAPDTPVIIVTGSVNENTATECIKAGASNYVTKHHMKRLGPAILYAIAERTRNLEHKKAKEALNESEKRYRSLFELSPVGFVVQDSNSTIINANEAYCRISGYKAAELIGKKIDMLSMSDNEIKKIKNNTARILSGEILRHEVLNQSKDGFPITIELTESAITLEDGSKGILSIAADITERKFAEKELGLKNKNLQFLSDFAMKLTSLSADGDIRKLIFDELRLFTNAEFAVLSEYYSKKHVLNSRYISVNQDIIDGMVEQTGINISNINIPVNEDCLKEMLSGKIANFSLLSDFTLGALPTEAGVSFKALTGIDRFHRISLYIGEELFGIAAIGLRADQPDPDTELLKSFAYLSSLTIRRRIAEEELRENEDRLLKIVNSSQDAMIIMNAEGNVNLWNLAAEKMFGYSFDEITGKNLHQIITPERYLESHLKGFSAFSEKGKGNAIGKLLELEAIRKNGEEFPIEIALSSIRIDNSWFTVGSVRDITERKQAQASAIRSEKRYHELFDANKDGIAVIRIKTDITENTFLEVNNAAAAMLGYTREEMINMPAYLYEVEISLQNMNQRRAMLEGNASYNFETQFIHKTGQLIPVEVSRSVVNFDGIPAVMNIVRDISERKFREKLQKMQYNIANAVIRAESLYDLYAAVRVELSELIDTSNFYIAFLNSNTGMMQAPFEKEEMDAFNEWPAEKSLTGYVIKQGKTILLNKNQITEMAESGIINRIGTRSEIWLGSPLFIGKKAIGAIVLQSYDNPMAFNKDSKFILELAAHELSSYIGRKESEQHALKLSKAVEQNPVSIIITDKDGIIDYVNPKFTAITGYSMAEAIGLRPSILKSGVHNDDFYKNLWDTINAGDDWQGEMRNKKKNGDLYWENAIISPIKNDNGEITHFVAVKEDITEKKRINEELKIAKEKAEESDRLKTAFLQNISHEIRTPLNGILGFSELLIQEWTSPEERIEYNEAIQLSGKRLIEIVGNVLDISIIETGQVILNPVRFSINSLMREIYNLYHKQALLKGLQLNYEPGSSDENFQITTDPSRIKQIMTNLLNNAFKYTKKGVINFGYIFNDGEVLFNVIDTGIGIDASYHQKIFTRFYQAELPSARNYEGAGLGLSISQGLVTAMGGKIWFESETGKGSSFHFSIPVSDAVGQQKDRSVNASTKPYSDIVLIADDDDTSYLLLMTILKNQKVGIMRAENGTDAVELVKKYKNIRLVFMDVKMPEMNGLEATRILKTLRPGLPVIMQTAYAFHDDMVEGYAAGCDEYISKPVSTDQIALIFEKYLGTGN